MTNDDNLMLLDKKTNLYFDKERGKIKRVFKGLPEELKMEFGGLAEDYEIMESLKTNNEYQIALSTYEVRMERGKRKFKEKMEKALETQKSEKKSCKCCGKGVSASSARAHARRLWERNYGPIPSIPKGWLLVHHIDNNPWNNELDNLRLMTKFGHNRHHILERLKEKNEAK